MPGVSVLRWLPRNRFQGDVSVRIEYLPGGIRDNGFKCAAHPREIFRPVVASGAYAFALMHNHPSGDPSPSAEDADLTERLRAGADLVGVVARDHVIVAAGGYFSFVEAGRWRR